MKINFDPTFDRLNHCLGVSDSRFIEMQLRMEHEITVFAEKMFQKNKYKVSQKDLTNLFFRKIECKDMQEAALLGFLIGKMIGEVTVGESIKDCLDGVL